MSEMSARADKTAHLSDIDKKILKILLAPNGNVHLNRWLRTCVSQSLLFEDDGID